MKAVRNTVALGIVAFLAAIASGCASYFPDRILQSSRALTPAANREPPAWLTSGSAPLPSESAALSLPEPDLFAAQPEPSLSVPRVEEERSPANYSVAESLPVVTSVSAVSPIGPTGPISPVGSMGHTSPTSPIVEPNWKPAGGSRVP